MYFRKTSNKCVGNSIVAICFVGIVLALLGFLFIEPILNVLGISGYDARCQEFTKQYLMIILMGIPLYMFTSAMSSIIRADGSPTYSMIATVVGAIINLILDPILIFGFSMGVKGAAIATIVGQIVSAFVCAIYFRKTKLIELNKDSFKINLGVCGKFLKLGISSFITQASIAIITIVANHVVGTIGGANATDAGGALGIVFKIFAIVLAFCLGVAVGGQPIIGYNYGAKKYKRVLDTYKCIIIANLVIGLISMLLFELCPGFIVSLFGGHANDLEFYQNYAILSFRIYLGGILLCCIQKSSCIFLQSINKPYKAMILSLMRDVVILVPGVCILGLCGDLYSMLWAGPVADIGAFIVTVIFVSIETGRIKKVIRTTDDVEEKVGQISKDRFVICIGREFGSGGKYIGQELAKRLNIKCYDNELLKNISENYDIDIKTLEKVDEKQKSSFWYSFATNYMFSKDGEVLPVSAVDNLFLKQARLIEELYQKENCVIIGRCSDFILKEKENVIKVFTYSTDDEFKINRKAKFEKLSKLEAIKKIQKVDRERAEYYKHFTSQEWGDRRNFDISIDTSKLGVVKSIDMLENYVKARITK